MNVFNNLRIGQRLGFGFGAVLVLLAATLLVGMQQLSSLDEKIRSMSENTMHETQLLATLRGAFDMRAIGARNLTLLKDSAAQKVELARIEEAQKALTKAMDDIEAAQKKDPYATDVDREMLAKTRELESKYEPVAVGIVGLAVAGQQSEAIVRLTRDCMPLLTAVVSHLEAFADHNAKRAAADTEDAAKAYASARMLMIGLGTVALLVGVGLAYALTRSVTQPVSEAVKVVQAVASGDLTRSVRVEGKDEVADLLRGLSEMQQSLQRLIGEVRNTTDGIATASSQIATGNQDLSARTEQTASSLQETASSMEQLTGTVKQTADSAHTANQLAGSAQVSAAKGGEVVAQVVATMEDINESSKKISDIIGVIDGIAFQTNILALNAAVEAARAGEQGRGFAVVASEVRNLAQRSANAAKEIKDLIGASVTKVESGSRLVADAGQAMGEIVANVQRVSDIIGEISAAAAEQSDGIGQVNGAVTNLDQMTQQNAALVEESAAAASSLKDQAMRLAQAVGAFRVAATYQASTQVIAHAQATSTVQSVARKPVSAAAKKPVVAKSAAAAPAMATSLAQAKPAAADPGGDWETF